MGLRDRMNARYFMPLVAGVDAARRDGRLAPAVYTPGLEPGNPGGGDGGINALHDPNINRPSITSPAQGATNVEVDAVATSSAFSSTDGQTHAKSRWVIEQRSDVAGPATTMMWWDSGPTSTDLTSISLADANLGRDITYAIKVRHKGAPGVGWSAWSPYKSFTVRGCGAVSVSCTQYRSEDVGNWAEYTGTWRNTLAEVAVDLAVAETLHQNNGVTYVGAVSGGSIRIYNPTFPGGCTVPATCTLVHTLSTTSRTGMYCTTPDPCVTLPPDADPPDEPDEPVFVPPPTPPVDPDPTDPTDPAGYANVYLNPKTSLVTALTTPKSLATASKEGGFTTSWNLVTLELAFDNASAVAGTLKYAVTCPGAVITPRGLRTASVSAHGTSVYPVQVTLPSNATGTYTITIDTGEDAVYTVKVGYTPPGGGSDL